MIRFKKIEEEALLHNPLKNFEIDAQPIEYREDPPSGFTSFIRTGRTFWAGVYKTDEAVLERLIEETRSKCFFCPEKVAASTPRFPVDFIPEGRLTRGEATLFPNLFAHKQYSAIIAITQKHYLKLNEFSPSVLMNALKLADSYVRRAHEVSASNMPKSAGTIFTPAEPAWSILTPSGDPVSWSSFPDQDLHGKRKVPPQEIFAKFLG
jgi:hypothetical protein